ncbi:MAG: hypothetical protein ACI4V7_08990 [Succinivibrionaceae bacterium]
MFKFSLICLSICACSLLPGCAFVSYNYEPECTFNPHLNKIEKNNNVFTTYKGEKILTYNSCTQKALKFDHTYDMLGYTVPFGTYVKIGQDDDGTEYYSIENTNGVQIQMGIFASPALGFLVEDDDLCVINDSNIYLCTDMKDYDVSKIDMPIIGNQEEFITYDGLITNSNKSFRITHNIHTIGSSPISKDYVFEFRANELNNIVEINNFKINVVSIDENKIVFTER